MEPIRNAEGVSRVRRDDTPLSAHIAANEWYVRTHVSRLVEIVLPVVLASCASGGAGPSKSAGNAPVTASTSAPSAGAADAPRPAEPKAASPPSPGAIFVKLESDLVACYEEGRKSLPAMTAGRITLHTSVDPSGKTTCDVPSDDSGLTQEVEECMRERVAREAYPPSGGAWTTAIPILVQSATVSFGPAPAKPLIETVESHGLSEEIYDVVDALIPQLKACTASLEKSSMRRVLYVAGRVGRDGHVECSLASSNSAITVEVRDCAARALARARFKPPKRGYGLISVPIEIVRRE
jgi:hypothetical protein